MNYWIGDHYITGLCLAWTISFIRFSLGPSTLPASSFVIWCNNSCIYSLFCALWNRHSLPLDISTPFIYQSLPLSLYIAYTIFGVLEKLIKICENKKWKYLSMTEFFLQINIKLIFLGGVVFGNVYHSFSSRWV